METHSCESRASEIVHEGITSEVERMATFACGARFEALGSIRASNSKSVKQWRTDVPARVINALGLEKVMFEAADTAVFAWYIKDWGPEVNLSNGD